MKRAALFIIKWYRKHVSVLKPASCRFYPTCSAYAIEAIERRGLFGGLLLATKRLLRCHPFSRGGYDPVDLEK